MSLLIILLIFIVLGFAGFIGFQITGAILGAALWLFLRLPLAILVWCLGLACCATLILIPVGICLLRLGLRILL